MRCSPTPPSTEPPPMKSPVNTWPRTGCVIPCWKRSLPDPVLELSESPPSRSELSYKEQAVIRSVIGIMCFLMLGGTGVCDVVMLANGDRVTGTVESLIGGKLAFSTPYAGRVFIDWRQVRSITTSAE